MVFLFPFFPVMHLSLEEKMQPGYIFCDMILIYIKPS